jgi:excisionase family DNA binding protein
MPTASDPPPEFLTRDDVARLLKVSRATVYRLVESRRLPFYKIGNRLRFDKQDVLAFLRHHRIDALGPNTYDRQKD